MAEKKADPKPEAAPAEAPAKARKLPIKTVAIIAIIMAVEGAAVFLILGMTGPAKSQGAVEKHTVESDEAEQTQEVLVVEDKFYNLQTGKPWIWDAAIYVQVKNKNADAVNKTLERRNAEIKEGISQIFSRAQHAQLKEPERQTLNRQLSLFFAEFFRTSDSRTLVEKVLIPRCRGFQAES